MRYKLEEMSNELFFEKIAEFIADWLEQKDVRAAPEDFGDWLKSRYAPSKERQLEIINCLENSYDAGLLDEED